MWLISVNKIIMFLVIAHYTFYDFDKCTLKFVKDLTFKLKRLIIVK